MPLCIANLPFQNYYYNIVLLLFCCLKISTQSTFNVGEFVKQTNKTATEHH